MHPPFGFALFYLRGIAPPEVKSRDIYLGSIPWIILQIILVAMMIVWPGMVSYWLEKPASISPGAAMQQLNDLVPKLDAPGGFDLGPPKF